MSHLPDRATTWKTPSPMFIGSAIPSMCVRTVSTLIVHWVLTVLTQ